jgi:hypothetical protein
MPNDDPNVILARAYERIELGYTADALRDAVCLFGQARDDFRMVAEMAPDFVLNYCSTPLCLPERAYGGQKTQRSAGGLFSAVLVMNPG